MPANRLLLPHDTDLVYMDDPQTKEPNPLRGKMTSFWLDALNKIVASISASSAVSGTNAIVAEVTLFSAAQAVDVTPTTVGAQLVVFFTQDATGGNYPAWSANFAPTTSVNVNTEALKTTTFSFTLKSDLLWWPTAYPVLEE